MLSKKTLANGLQLVTAPMSGLNSVTVLVMVKVGSRYESRAINGAAHFVEHMLFKGTTNRATSQDISRELDRIGAHFNAFTSKDHTGYYIKAASSNINLAFDVLADMIWNSTFVQEELDKERGVIVEEINMYEDNPLISIDNNFEQTIFSGPGGLGQDIAGPKKVIKTISRKNLFGFKEKFYQPANMLVSVAGNFNQSKVTDLAKKYFSNSSGKSFPKHKKFTSKQSRPRVHVNFKDTKQVHLALGVPSYSYGHKSTHALTLLSTILGGNMSSRLFVRIREQHGLAYSVHTHTEPYSDTGSFHVTAGLDKSRIKPALKLILQELANVRDHGVTDEELTEAKNFLAGSTTLQLEDSENVANWYAKQQLMLGRTKTPAQRIAALKKVTRAEVKAVAKNILKSDKLNLAVVGPFKDPKVFQKILRLP